MDTIEENNLYHKYNKPLFPKLNKRIHKLSMKFAKWFFILGVVFTIISFAPSIWYSLSPKKFNVSELLAGTARNPDKSAIQVLVDPTKERSNYQPRLDRSLPTDNQINIKTAGIKTTVNEAPLENLESALRVGVWRVPNFGTPYDRENPTILAAHRFGYLKWSIPYRLKNSFYNLTKVEVGDSVEIIWKQRRYIYEVYAEGKGEEISDYSADLILYTCESLDSPIRLFKYARLLEI